MLSGMQQGSVSHTVIRHPRPHARVLSIRKAQGQPQWLPYWSPYEIITTVSSWCRGIKDTKSDLNMYGRTKAFNLMTSSELNRRLAASGVVCLARGPGCRAGCKRL